MKKAALVLGLFFSVTSFASDGRADPVTLKFGTLAPPESPWGRVFKLWARATDERSHSAVQIQFFWNGTQGDEGAMVGKIRTGQLDGAAISALGLGQIYKQALLFQLPGIFASWAKLDAARNALRPQMDPEFERQGFKVVGWGDMGIGRFMSAGYDVKSPNDLKHKATFYEPTDPIDPMTYSVLGDITPRAVSIPEVLPGLTSNSITFVNAPSLVAEQLQWAARLDHLNTLATHYEIGALVVKTSRLTALPADAQSAVLDTGRVAAEALTTSIRREDDAAFARRQQRMTTYTPNAAEVQQWNRLFADTRARLRGTTFTAALVDEAVRQGS
ncbi:MAG TPA: TRAP transporter substrate-binding protein DctP [Polyangiaceae bacterium]|jgi:TRAP-type C4-dicarboxylate transport system substrate-binding protein